MNKKQLIVMWIGIALIILLHLFYLVHFYTSSGHISTFGSVFFNLMVENVWVIIALLTVGLIFTLSDKKDKKPKDE